MERGDWFMNKKEKELLKEAVKLCSEYDWSSEYSMRFALSRTRDFLIENFDLDKK